MTEQRDAHEVTDDDTEAGGLSGRAKLGLTILAFGVVVPGVLDFFFTRAGAPGLGMLVWAIGFGSAVVALWYVLLRPLDLGAETEG